jgi:precorrin-6B methylase 2
VAATVSRWRSNAIERNIGTLVPYRIDLPAAGNHLLDRLIELGALDVESSSGHDTAAVMPDSVTPEQVASALGIDDIAVSPAVGRDDGSIWVLSPAAVDIGSVRIVPSDFGAEHGNLKLIESTAFGTGLHPTTALCLHALNQIVPISSPSAMLDVGTGSGILALAALTLGVPEVRAVDVDDQALRVARANAQLNGFESRLRLSQGGPETVTGVWPLVVANILAAPLIEMAPALVRLVAHHGQLVLSGVADAMELDVARAYVHLGMHRIEVMRRGGWIALTLRASW